MHAATWDVRDLPHIAEPQVLGADQLRRMIATARHVSQRARDHWFELAPDERRAIIQIADRLDSAIRDAEAEARQMRKRDFFIAFWTGLRALVATTLSQGTNTPLIIAFVAETVTLRNAVHAALAAEREVERGLLDRVTVEQNFIADVELREAREAYANGCFVTATPDELRARAERKVQGEKAQAQA
jgi:hypothetical protein